MLSEVDEDEAGAQKRRSLLIEENLVSYNMVTLSTIRRGCPTSNVKGEEKKSLPYLNLNQIWSLVVWIRFEETGLVDEMLMVVMLILCSD